MYGPEVVAAKTMVAVSTAVKTKRIVETVLAMVIMWEREPRFFKSDRAAWIQIARRFRNLSDVACVTYHDAASGKTKRVYRNFPKLAGEALGQMLMEGLGAFGLHIHRSNEHEMQRVMDARAKATVALTSMPHDVDPLPHSIQ
jgi:hypothetical protein